jgi:hypothetical protein
MTSHLILQMFNEGIVPATYQINTTAVTIHKIEFRLSLCYKFPPSGKTELPIFGRIAIFQMISSKIIRRFCQAET